MPSFTVVLLIMVGFAGCLGAPLPPAPGRDQTAFGVVTDEGGDAEGILDVLGGRLIETPAAIVAEIDVASYSETEVVDLLAKKVYRSVHVHVCWNPDWYEIPGPQGHECAGVVFSLADPLEARGVFELFYGPSDGCNDWQWCSWHVPHEIMPGSPATIRVTVPRDLLPNASVGYGIGEPNVQTTTWKNSPSPLDMTGRRAWATVCPAVQCVRQTVGVPQFVFVDTSAAGTGMNLTMPTRSTISDRSPKTILVDSSKDVRDPDGKYRADLDILSVDLEETADEITYRAKIANLPAAPTHSVDLEFATDGIVYEAWYGAVGGEVVEGPLAGYCADAQCNAWREFVPKVTLVPGSPGEIRVSLPRDRMASPPRGSIVSLAEFELGDFQVARSQSKPPLYVHAAVGSSSEDSVWNVEPYFLQFGARP